jgi:glutaredoxin 3
MKQLSRLGRIAVEEQQVARGLMPETPEIVLYRMVLSDHICPYGLLAKRMLDDSGLEYDERVLHTRDEVDGFKAEHEVATTPQVFIDGERIGGSDELADYLKRAKADA